MQKKYISLPQIKLVGISIRTSNAAIFSAEPATNPIALTIGRYFQAGIANQIDSRINPGVTYCVYTDYESDLNGAYTYFIGEAVSIFDNVSKDLVTLTIPAQKYVKFTNEPGPMPTVCVGMWQNIWKMSTSDLGGERAYLADFELYDERSIDQGHAVLDIMIGIQ